MASWAYEVRVTHRLWDERLFQSNLLHLYIMMYDEYNETEWSLKNISSKGLHHDKIHSDTAQNKGKISQLIGEFSAAELRTNSSILDNEVRDLSPINTLGANRYQSVINEASLVEVLQFLRGIKDDVQVLTNTLEDLQLGRELPAIKRYDASKMSPSVSSLTGRTISGLSNSTDTTSLKIDLHHSYITNIRTLRRNALSEFEILRDYYVRLREGDPDPEFRTMKDDYHQIGCCSLISSLAERWFDGWHVLNHPLKVQCLLVYPDKGGVRCKDGSYPQQMGKMRTNMMCFKWKTGCLWEKQEGDFAYPVVESKAAIHYTVLVTVGPSREMLIDWNIGQFDHESIKNALLFCPKRV
jgi:hypothetical protein